MEYDIYLIRCSDAMTSLFMPELQKGFYISSSEGKSVYSFLTEDCGLSDEYISRKVKTVLIDGGPVDDIFSAGIKDGGVCALSGAMPGIVGAMMRIGSPYAAMRESITVKPDLSSESGREINFQLKLFNVILSDKGIDFLKRGILIEKKRVYGLFKKHGAEIYSNCIEIIINGLPAENNVLSLSDGDSTDELVVFQIEIEEENINESKS